MVKEACTKSMKNALYGSAVSLAEVRKKLRQKGEYELADNIRGVIDELGFSVEDTTTGQYRLHSNSLQWHIHYACDGTDFPYTAKEIADRITEISKGA